MQKKSNFVKFHKIFTVFCIFVVLILSIIASNLIISWNTQPKEANRYGTSSMYKQLEAYSTPTLESADAEEKMNNLIFKNANRVESVGEANRLRTEFDGKISVLYTDEKKICEMSLEDYTLYSLVAEMPQSFELEALMAQSVAIRTYAVRCALYGSKHENADVCDDYRCCQSMIHPENINFDISKGKAATQSTAGIVAMYEGVPILAAYHSSSYGMTKSASEVWGGEVDYLVPVFAPEDKETAAYTVSIDKNKVESVFEKNGLDGDIAFIYGEDGMCDGAKVGGKKLEASELKRILGLRSDTFDVAEDESGYTFVSYGYGHGVGMSQYGADALAKKGYSFYEILKYYYTGISFAFLK